MRRFQLYCTGNANPPKFSVSAQFGWQRPAAQRKNEVDHDEKEQ
jgi:rRNA maturation protein Nop10